MAKWRKAVHKLAKDHGWKCKPGYNIFVADRGALRFDYPAHWHVEPGSDSIKFHDRKPPDDDCLLQVSLMRLPPGIDWSGLPLTQLLEEVVRADTRSIIARGETIHQQRPDLEWAWTEVLFIDPNERRQACSRACLARVSNIQPLITMDFWLDDKERFAPVWAEVLRTLQLGQYVQDPTRGRVLH
jgi:hypothetical protein